MARELARWSVLRPRISDCSCRKEQRALRWKPPGHGDSLAGESTSVVSSRLRDFLCRQICQRKSASPQPELLGTLGRLQILKYPGGGAAPILEPMMNSASQATAGSDM